MSLAANLVEKHQTESGWINQVVSIVDLSVQYTAGLAVSFVEKGQAELEWINELSKTGKRPCYAYFDARQLVDETTQMIVIWPVNYIVTSSFTEPYYTKAVVAAEGLVQLSGSIINIPEEIRAPESSTAIREEPSYREQIRHGIRSLFVSGRDEVFEDGMESTFSRELLSAIRQYGNLAIQIISELILNEEVDPEVASEALRWIGYIEDAATYEDRLSLLERSLRCSSPWVRDGAALGLAYLDDPHAIRYLKRAIEQEPYKLLCRNMEQVVTQLLEGSASASVAEKDTV